MGVPAQDAVATPPLLTSPALELSCVTKRYPKSDRGALNGVTVSIPQGAFAVILGPSGSGKSTLLRAIVGLIDVDGGVIRVDGEALTRKTRKQIRRKIGMIHQHFALVGRLTTAENVMAGAAASIGLAEVAGKLFPKEVRQRAVELLADVGLPPDSLNRPARTLSGGQQQRVGIARALMARPRLVLADEPIASLDPRTAQDIMILLRDLAAASNTTVVCSLHNVDLARAFATHIIALREGEVVHHAGVEALTDTVLPAIYGEHAGETALSAPRAGRSS